MYTKMLNIRVRRFVMATIHRETFTKGQISFTMSGKKTDFNFFFDDDSG